MDRNEGIIRWSPNPSRDEFMHINLNHRIVQLYTATGHAKPGRFDYEKRSIASSHLLTPTTGHLAHVSWLLLELVMERCKSCESTMTPMPSSRCR
jgi:hypothetical protein